MLFQDDHIRQIRAGEKTATRRAWETPQVKEGGVYIASTEMFCSHEEADCYIRVTDVYKQRLRDMTAEDADKEGGYSYDEFIEVWRDINGDWRPDKEVTVVEFEYVGREPSEDVTDGGQATLQEVVRDE
jgi:hypothetical protein